MIIMEIVNLVASKEVEVKKDDQVGANKET
jgi:hypothetical protein